MSNLTLPDVVNLEAMFSIMASVKTSVEQRPDLHELLSMFMDAAQESPDSCARKAEKLQRLLARAGYVIVPTNG